MAHQEHVGDNVICTQHAQAASEMSIVNFTATIASETKSVASAPAFPIHYIGMPHGTRSMLELMAEMTDTLCQLRSYLHISSLSRHREPATTGQLSARLSENAWIEGRTKSDGNKGEHREVDAKDLADYVLSSGCLPDAQCHLAFQARRL